MTTMLKEFVGKDLAEFTVLDLAELGEAGSVPCDGSQGARYLISVRDRLNDELDEILASGERSDLFGLAYNLCERDIEVGAWGAFTDLGLWEFDVKPEFLAGVFVSRVGVNPVAYKELEIKPIEAARLLVSGFKELPTLFLFDFTDRLLNRLFDLATEEEADGS